MKTLKPQYRRFIRSSLITFGIAGLIILGLHLWFVHNAKRMIINIVASESKGKLRMDLSEFSYDFFSDKIQVKQANLVSTDTLTAPVTYALTFKKLTLKSTSFFSAIFGKKITFDSIKLHEPDIVITQWRKDTTRRSTEDLSISQEMGQLYNSMLDALDAFAIRRIWIRDAKMSLVNKMKPEEKPVTVSNINFNLLRAANSSRKRDEFVENEQTVDLGVTEQDILLPGGRHKLSFKTFTLALFRKRIELDSCTVTAIATDSTKSSYTVFFNKLLLVGVDFEKMYRHNLIKADSVYCENPLFNIHINTATAGAEKNEKTGKKERPNPEKIIQELTGDMELAFVGVKDAGFRINIHGKKKRSLFNSNQDDFEMHGLTINADSSKLVSVKRFDMLVRDYQLYDKDSATAYSFDSIHFINNKIVLNNFTVLSNGKQSLQGSIRNFNIPYFELTGLDWYKLVFEETLEAREAVLRDPVIFYTRQKSTAQKKKNKNIFRSLQTLDDLITLNKITVENGQIHMKMGTRTDIAIADANLVLYSDRLLESTNNEGVRRSVEKLSFSKANIRLNDMNAVLTNARYTGRDLLHADRIDLTTKGKKVNASLNKVEINNLFIDEDRNKMFLSGLKWNSGKISINAEQSNAAKKGKGEFSLENLHGRNTSVRFLNDKMSVSTFVNSLRVASVSVVAGRHPQLEGLVLGGNKLDLKQEGMMVNVGSYEIESESGSFLNQVKFQQVKGNDTISFRAPRVNFTVDRNSAFLENANFENVHLISPVIRINQNKKENTGTTKKPKLNLNVNRFSISEPDIHIALHNQDSVTMIHLPPSPGSVLRARDISTGETGLSISNLFLNTTAATFTKKNGEVVGVQKGLVDLEISDIQYSTVDGVPSWNAWINRINMENPEQFLLGKNKNVLKVGNTSFGNVKLSSGSMNNFSRMLKLNLSAWLKTGTGSYSDSTVKLNWYNADFNADKKLLSLDSFKYSPALSRDSFVKSKPYQVDYITLATGKIELSDFDLDRYEKDSSLLAKTMDITDPVISIYRDKQPPFKGGVRKHLPVDMIKMITLPVSVERLRLREGLLNYTEKNAKTGAEGTVTLTHLNATLGNIKNRKITETDSLLLTMNAYLMDSTFLNLVVKESYADSLSGFLMTLKMRPTSLSFLNPILIPLSNVRITSGVIDSFEVRAIGKEDLAIGEMKMFYHDLRIQLLKNGEETKSGIGKRIITSLVNTFFIKKNNEGRTGIIYFERAKDRSFFNYIVKMTFSGMATSIGVIKNRKYMKKYEKELKERNLPPIQLY